MDRNDRKTKEAVSADPKAPPSSPIPQKRGAVQAGQTFREHPERINRKGRPIKPRSQIELEQMLDDLGDEDIIVSTINEMGLPEDVVMSRMRYMLLTMMQDRNPAARIHILDRRYGKVKQQVQIVGKDDGNAVIDIIIHDDTGKGVGDIPNPLEG